MQGQINIFWFRRDLRLIDNAALYHALRSDKPVLPIFIFDTNILEELETSDSRVNFIYNEVLAIHHQLRKMDSGLKIFHSGPIKAFEQLVGEYNIGKVFTNHDYEAYANDRDDSVKRLLNDHDISFHTFKDQVIFEKNEIVKNDESPYVVFTPYSRKWKEELNSFYLKSYPVEKYYHNFHKHHPAPLLTLESIGFRSLDVNYPSREVDDNALKDYGKHRDYPALEATTRLGIHLRFGTISIRELAARAKKISETYLNELIWREFYQMILWHFPHISKGEAFKKGYDNINWRNNELEFKLWCEGNTGYPLVDAGMRQLNETGFMHNRVRMITASFLAKHLLIDWRWGESYFASKLLDYEFASNNGGWQWSVGSGCDASPYFRIFNPALQAKKFDPQLEYIRRWVPEFDTGGYPPPIVEHEFARKRCLEVYGKAVREKV